METEVNWASNVPWKGQWGAAIQLPLNVAIPQRIGAHH